VCTSRLDTLFGIVFVKTEISTSPTDCDISSLIVSSKMLYYITII
jgi:hypothetical protein